MAKTPKPSARSKQAEDRRTASALHDAQFFKDRKAKEASNLALTLKLRAQRIAHEAAQPKVPKAPSPRRRGASPADD